jgi:hypothetical protein
VLLLLLLPFSFHDGLLVGVKPRLAIPLRIPPPPTNKTLLEEVDPEPEEIPRPLFSFARK